MRIKEPKKGFEKLNSAKSRIIAHLIGDGCLYKTNSDYVLKYEVKDEELLNQFAKDIVSVYGLKPSFEINYSGKTGKPINFVRLRSKIAYVDLLNYSSYYSKDWKLKKAIIESKLNLKKEFLKALFDDEGTIANREIRLYSINKKGIEQIQSMLLNFGIESKIRDGYGERRNVFGLIVLNKLKFKNKIGFNLKRKQEKLEAIL